MGLTKNWKRLNLFQTFYTRYFLSINQSSIVTFPFQVQVQDGTWQSPKWGVAMTQTYVQDPNVVYGCLRYGAQTNNATKGAIGGFKLALGSGTTPFDENDYCLENEIISTENSARESGRNNNVNIIMSSFTGTSCTMEICGKNNTENTWNVNEVGIYSWIAQPSSVSSITSSEIKNCLIFREVLPNTLVVEPNQSYSIKFQLSY